MLDRLRALFDYNPDTGRFVRKNGKLVRKSRGKKPVRVKVDGKSYLAAECAWLWMTGEWPTRRVIHLDGNVKNDCWSNLELKPLDRPQPFSAQGSMEEELSKLGLI